MCTHADIHTNIRHAECATPISNGMPRVCARPHCSRLGCLLLSSQFTATRPLSLSSSCDLKRHTLTCMQSSQACQIFSLINWLYFILFNTTTSLAFLECPSPHTCRKVCESNPPPYFQTLTFDDLMNCSETPAGCMAQQNPV